MNKKILVLSLIVLFLIQTLSFAHWADSNINILNENEVLEIVLDDVGSRLDIPITREEFFSLMAVAKNISSEIKVGDFADYSEINSKYLPYINGLVENGIVTGSPYNGNLYIYPKSNITRQEASVILSKMLGLDDNEYVLSFEDSNFIEAWALPYIKGVVKADIIKGYPDDTVRPKKNITVAEAICMIGNAYSKGYMENGEVFAGTGEIGSANSDLLNSTFSYPFGLATKDSAIFVADTNSNMIRKIEGNNVTTLAGKDIGRDEYNEAIGSFKDGEDALFDSPSFIISVENGFLVTDSENNVIRFIDDNGYTTTYAGTKKAGYTNGKVDEASFNNPTGIAVDEDGNIYIADTGSNVIRKIDSNKNVTTFAGNEKAGYKDGKLLQAQFNSPVGLLYVDDALYVVDSGNQRIRMIKDDVVTTIAGTGIVIDEDNGEFVGDLVDEESGVAEFNFPMSLAIDKNGNLYVADYGNGVVRKVSKSGNVSTVIIDGLKRPVGVLVCENELYVSDALLNIIYRIKIH